MKFVTALTISPCDLNRVIQMWDGVDNPHNYPFDHVLVSPLFASPTTLKIVRELKDKRGSEVYFDSGGYYVQQGRLAYQELYGRLLKFYWENQWADWYVLPDHVPTSQDDSVEVEYKVRDTFTVARLFYEELPQSLRSRAIPVVQGHTYVQIQRCVDTYVDMGVKYIGFGSFSTAGVNNSINQLTTQSLDNLGWVCALAAKYDLKLHLFGMTTPPLIWLFNKLGAYSFDSLGWNKAANYGNVYLPFVRAYNISYRDPDQVCFSAEQFELMKTKTGHDCPFCSDFEVLSREYHYRRAHNLAVLQETAQHCHTDEAAMCVEQYAPQYLKNLMWRSPWLNHPHSTLG